MKALTIKNSTTSEFATNSKGQYVSNCYEMYTTGDVWERNFVAEEHKKTVYFTEDRYGLKTYYIKHKKQFLLLENRVVSAGCDFRNRKWCFVSPA